MQMFFVSCASLSWLASLKYGWLSDHRVCVCVCVGVGSGQHCHYRRTDGALVLDARLQVGEAAVLLQPGMAVWPTSIGQSQAQWI